MDNETNSTYGSREVSLSRTIRFWLLFLSEIPALSCSIFILYHFIMDYNQRRSLNTHTIILLNITGFIFICIDVPLYLNFILVGKVWPSIPAHCLIWWVVDLGFYYTCSMLTAWASIERHILIFCPSWLATRKRRFFAHYLPLGVIIVYAITYYTWILFFLSCESKYTYDLPVCGAVPCYLNDPFLGPYELGVHGCMLTMIIAIFNIALVIRVIVEKRLRQQAIQWRKHRKMTIQMLLISSVFIIFNLPITVMYIAHMIGLPADVGVDLQLYFFFITYWLLFSLPFVCLNSLPDLKQKLRKVFRRPCRMKSSIGIALQTNH